MISRVYRQALLSVDGLSGLFLTILGLFCSYEMRFVQQLVVWDESGPGPAWLPLVMSLILTVLGLKLAMSALLVRDNPSYSFSRPTLKYTILIMSLASLFPVIGGLSSLTLFVAMELWWVEQERMSFSIMVSLIVAFVVWFVFIRLLGVAFPLSPWGF